MYFLNATITDHNLFWWTGEGANMETFCELCE